MAKTEPPEDEPDYVRDARNDMLKHGFTPEEAQGIIDTLRGKTDA
jgi:hypothetical protein